MTETPSELSEHWSGTKCPEYDGDDDEHQINISQQLVIVNGGPAIELTGQCTCGWMDQTTLTEQCVR